MLLEMILESPRVFLSDYAFDMKFGTVILSNVTKKMVEKFFKIAAIGLMTTQIMLIFLKNYAING